MADTVDPWAPVGEPSAAPPPSRSGPLPVAHSPPAISAWAPVGKPTAAPSEEETAVRLAYAEGDANPTGWQAVAAVAKNRADASGQSIAAVAAEPHQFEGYGNARYHSLDVGSPQYNAIASAIAPVLAGKIDPTGGADSFYSPRAQAQLAKTDNRPLKPGFDNGKGQLIGSQLFFKGQYHSQSNGWAPVGPPTDAIDTKVSPADMRQFLAAGRKPVAAAPAPVRTAPAVPKGPPTNPARAIASPIPGLTMGDLADEGGSLVGGLLAGGRKIVQGLGHLADTAAQGQAGMAAATGVMPVDTMMPGMGAPPVMAPVPQVQRPGLAQIAAERTPIATPYTDAVGQTLGRWDQAVAPANRNPAESLLHGVGEMVPQVAAGPLAPVAFAASAYQDTYEEALSKGATPEQADHAANLAGMLSGAIGGVPAGGMVDAAGTALLKRFAAKTLAKYDLIGLLAGRAPTAEIAAQTAAHTAGTGVQMGGVQVAQNAVAEGSYDPNRPLFQGVPEQIAMGAVTGGAVHGAHAALSVMGGAERASARIGLPVPDLHTVPSEGGPFAPPQTPAPSPTMPTSEALDRYRGQEAPPAAETPAGPQPTPEPAAAFTAPLSPSQTPPNVETHTVIDINGQRHELHVTPEQQAAPPMQPGDVVGFRDEAGLPRTGHYEGDIGMGFHRVLTPDGRIHEIGTDDIVKHEPTIPPPDPTLKGEAGFNVQAIHQLGIEGDRDGVEGALATFTNPPAAPGIPDARDKIAADYAKQVLDALPPPPEGSTQDHGLHGALPERPQGTEPGPVPEPGAGGNADQLRPGAGASGGGDEGRGAGAPAEGRAGLPEGPAGPASDRGAGDEPVPGPAGSAEGSEPRAAGLAAPEAAAGLAANHVIEPGGTEEGRGLMQKARDNLTALKLAKEIEAEKRPATPDEQKVLAKYVGWGGLPGAFEQPTGGYGTGFEAIGPELKATLSPTEYAAAARSTQYAHYTAENVIRPMWQAVQDMGFKGGHVLEPGMGIGHFLGMAPPDLAHAIKYQGIEYDPTTARIAKLLYPKSGVQRADFTRAPIPENAFDLAIGNPPFGDIPIKADPKYAARGFLLHDYFFAKSLDSVRPGGLLGFVTSAGTMNKLDASVRRFMAQRAEFVGGVRLPDTAFKKNANTQVTTDVLFFKKRALPLSESHPEVDAPWTQTVQRELPNAAGEPQLGNVNRYFSEHPEQVLGNEGFFDKLYKDRYGVHAREGEDLEAALRQALGRLPRDVMSPPPNPEERAAMDFASGQVKDGSYYVGQDGRLMQHFGGAGVPVRLRGEKSTNDGSVSLTKAQHEIVKHLLPIRDALRDVFAHDLAENAEGGAEARARMNAHYEAFVAQHGPINLANFEYRRPTRVQLEAERAKARETARSIGEPWEEGDYDASAYPDDGLTLAEHARNRDQMRQVAGESGFPFEEGYFNAAEVPDLTIVKRPNIDPFMDDPESYRLRSIEHYDDFNGTHAKKEIFDRSILARRHEPELKSAEDGVLWSLNQTGRLDLDAVADKMGRDKATLVAELGDKVFRLPGADDTFQSRDEYLSGDVATKLAQAQAMAGRDPGLRRNVEALEAAQPAPLAPGEITMTLGMPWMGPEPVREFARDVLKIGDVKPKYVPQMGAWFTEHPRQAGEGEAAWSTERMNARDQLDAALNRKAIRIYDRVRNGDGTTDSIFNPVATQAAQDKVKEIKQAFEDWLEGDEARRGKLADDYNEAMNRTVPRQFDGSYLTTPGVAAKWEWRPHQRRVVARVVQVGNTYMAHAVGAGKTSAMIGAAMEMRRLGTVKKPVIAVPDHMLGQFAKEWYEQYPTANIMVADEKRFHTSRRKQFIANAAQDDLDAIIIPHTALGLIPMSREFQDRLAGEEIENLEEAIRTLPKDDASRFTQKKLEAQKQRLEQKLLGAMGKRKDQTLTFEEMGADFLFVDEAHLFRKLTFTTQQNLKGIDSQGSDRAWDLYSKLRYLEEKNPGRSAVLASGTPITNTMGELYSLSRFIQPDALAERGLQHFDAWAATFGDTVTGLEQNAAGGYDEVTRFARFVNAPELYKMVARNMDVVTSSQLDQYVTRPTIKGTAEKPGERELHLVEPTDEVKAILAGLNDRMKAIKARKGPPQKGDDITLSVLNDGIGAAIDPRFVNPHADPHSASKLNEMIATVHRIWGETADHQFYDPARQYADPAFRGPATQMIFANHGINATEKRPFSAYKWIKDELVRKGVPAKEIAFIGDYSSAVARQKLFNDMNEGKVRILIGSTQKMATGINAQRRLYALHNLDPLWYPADDEQRVGRILRQGNFNPQIEVHDYAAKGTYDATKWQMMGRKGRFNEQFMRGDPSLRNLDDLGEASVYEQIAAMSQSDPRVIELTQLRHDLDRAQRQAAAHESNQYAMRGQIKAHTGSIERAKVAGAAIARDIAGRIDTKGEAFKMSVGGESFTKRVDAAKAAEAVYMAAFPSLKVGASAKIGEVGGFPVRVTNIYGSPRFEIGFTGHWAELGDKKSSMAGVIQSAERRISGLEGEAEYHERQQTQALTQIEALKAQIGKPFEGADKIAQMRAAHRTLEAQIADTASGAPAREAPALAQEAEPVNPQLEAAKQTLSDMTSGRQLSAGFDPAAFGAIATIGQDALRKGLGAPVDRLGGAIVKTAERLMPEGSERRDVVDDLRRWVVPMAAGKADARAAAKDFANTWREITWEGTRLDAWLKASFTPEQRQRMWSAADEESVIRQGGREPGRGEGLNGLAPEERTAVEELQRRAQAVFAMAQSLEMTDAEALPSYVPRMLVALTQSGATRLRGKSAETSTAEAGGNLSTSSANLIHRKYATVAETERAAQHIDPNAVVVRDIRTLGLAMTRMQRAIAGRLLMDKMKAVSDDVGSSVMSEGPGRDPAQWWTLPGHPAFRKYQLEFVKDADGKMVPRLDQEGRRVFKPVAIYLHKSVEGPMRAVLTTPSHPAYQALMAVKSRQMSLIMFSPLIHNAVIWGKAIPADPIGVLTLQAYFKGYAGKNDPAVMREAMGAGLVPVAHRFQLQDLTGIAQDPQIEPGHSWTSKLIGAIPGLFDKRAGDATKAAVDKLGNLWHNTFLWDRVADLQMGLYLHMRDAELKRGTPAEVAQKIAAHYANRYAGVIPLEAMSKQAREIANVVLFSRSFTLGNIAAFKDLVAGLPPDIQAQILRSRGVQALGRAQGAARAKALGMIAIDVALAKVGLTLASMAVQQVRNWVTGQNLPTQTPGQNEPGKEERFLIGHEPDGTAIYGRLPTGKVGEDLMNWVAHPVRTFMSKLAPLTSFINGVLNNDAGFGRKMYDPYASTPAADIKNIGAVVWAALERSGPEGWLAGVGNLATGTGDHKTAAMQALLPLAGITVSRGFPGGEAAGIRYRALQEFETRKQHAMPQIRAEIKSGDPAQIARAKAQMKALGVPGHEIGWTVHQTQHPQMTRGQKRNFNQYASPDEKARLQAAVKAAQVRRAAGVPSP